MTIYKFATLVNLGGAFVMAVVFRDYAAGTFHAVLACMSVLMEIEKHNRP